jgi:hypothetical protein
VFVQLMKLVKARKMLPHISATERQALQATACSA